MSCCDTDSQILEAEDRILLAGQPNAGKTSVFNALTGGSQRVGNWPGVTVERKEASCRFAKKGTTVVDIPGTYSLESTSPDEVVARDALAAFPQAVIINIVDATLLKRQLTLTLELLALRRPMVIALTMLDELAKSQIEVDLDGLSKALGVPVLAMDGRTGRGAAEVVKAAVSSLASRAPSGLPPAFSGGSGSDEARADRSRAAGAIARDNSQDNRGKTDRAEKSRGGVAVFLDRMALSPLAGPLVFLTVVFAMFEITFGLGSVFVGLFQRGLDGLGDLAKAIPQAMVASFVKGALLGGVGNVLLLVPYVFFMFLILSFLEDSGYMARAVFATDALMRRIGLNGKAFIPLIMGFGCNVPAIMAIRTIESPRDRLRTTLMVPFTSCSARLPVYVVVAGAFFGRMAGLVIFSLYLSGMIAGILTAALSSRFIAPEKGGGLVMEIPPYRFPLARNLLREAWNRTRGYLAKAGTLIFAASAILWLLMNLPLGTTPEASIIGLFGHFIAPVFAPLGFDWRLTVGLISGIAAKEVLISTLGLLAGQGAPLAAALPGMMGSATALAFLVFTLLYTPCLATLAVMKSETGSRKWTTISLLWSLILAYSASLVARLIGLSLGLSA